MIVSLKADLFQITVSSMSMDGSVSKDSCRKYVVKIFEPFVNMGHVLDVPMAEDGSVSDDVLGEEISSFVFEQLDSGANVPFQYAVHRNENGYEIWLTLGNFVDKSSVESAALKEEIDSLNKKYSAKVKSLESRLEAELLTKVVEFEEKEISLQKEVIELRLKHAKDTAELRARVTDYEEKIRLLEARLAESENDSIKC